MSAPLAPPPGFIEVPSRVEGIVVFAPRPEDEDAPDGPVATTCPGCGAPAAFDPRTQAVTCDRCGTTGAGAVAVGNLDAAEGHEFTLEALRRCASGWGVERRTLHCGQCGADLAVEPGALATTCPLCASHKVELIAGDDGAVRPGWVLPFQVPPADLAKPVRAWLGAGWMHPGNLGELARVDRFVGLYVPYWIFDADVRAAYECEVGTERRVTTRRNGRTHTTTEITWRWTKGSVAPRYTGVRVPGTARLSKVLLGRTAARFDLAGLVRYAPELLAGFQAQSYDVALPEAWEAGRAFIREESRRACVRDAGGDRVRNMRMTAGLDNEVWRYVLLPVYVTAYRFEDRTFQVMVNGQTGAVHGQKPVVWWRIYTVIACMFIPGVTSGVLGLPLLLVGGLGSACLIFGFVALIFAVIGSVALYRHAADQEAV